MIMVILKNGNVLLIIKHIEGWNIFHNIKFKDKFKKSCFKNN